MIRVYIHCHGTCWNIFRAFLRKNQVKSSAATTQTLMSLGSSKGVNMIMVEHGKTSGNP